MSQRVIEVAENQAVVGTVMPKLDLHSGLINWTVVGGADAALFSVNRENGRLSFTKAVSVEVPRSSRGDSRFQCEVQIQSHSAVERVNLSVRIRSKSTPSATVGSALIGSDSEGGNLQLLGIHNNFKNAVFVSLNGNRVTPTSIPHADLTAVATHDGHTFYHVHQRPTGPVFMRTRCSVKGHWQTVLLDADRKALVGIEALSTSDGETFVAIQQVQREFRFRALKMIGGRKLISSVAKPEPPSAIESPMADAVDICATSDGRFYLLRCDQGAGSIVESTSSDSIGLIVPDESRPVSTMPSIQLIGIAGW